MAGPRSIGWLSGYVRASRIDSGIHLLAAPAWIAAIAAVVFAVAVIVALGLARKALSAHARELADQHELTSRLAEAVALQVKDLRLSLDERRRAQAGHIFLELNRLEASAPSEVIAAVHNNSLEPVYDLYVIWQLGTVRMGKPDRAARLMPGSHIEFTRQSEPPADAAPSDPDGVAEPAAPDPSAALSAFLTFRDAAGVRWTVREDGTLTDITRATDARP